MSYNAVPATIVSVESGHIVGPGKGDPNFMAVDTECLAEIADAKKEDETRNVIVVTVDNLVKKAKGEASMEALGFKVDDARNIVRDLLIHLAMAGDDVAKFLLSQLHTVMQKDDEERENEE